MSQLRSLHLLSFVTGRCFVLLNDHWLLQLHWQCQEAEPQILTCCSIKQPTPEGGDDAAVHQCVCGGAAFVLSSSGLICILIGHPVLCISFRQVFILVIGF